MHTPPLLPMDMGYSASSLSMSPTRAFEYCALPATAAWCLGIAQHIVEWTSCWLLGPVLVGEPHASSPPPPALSWMSQPSIPPGSSHEVRLATAPRRRRSLVHPPDSSAPTLHPSSHALFGVHGALFVSSLVHLCTSAWPGWWQRRRPKRPQAVSFGSEPEIVRVQTRGRPVRVRV